MRFNGHVVDLEPVEGSVEAGATWQDRFGV